MEKKKQKSLQSSNDFTPEDLKIIQALAFHQIFEPFEINLALKVIRETRVKIEKKINPLLQKTSFLKKGITSLKTKWSFNFSQYKKKLPQLKKNSSDKTEIFGSWKKNYSQWEEKIKNNFFIQLDKGLSIVFERQFEKLVIQKSERILDIELKNIIAVQQLSRANRMLLLKNMYPFELSFTGNIRKTINQTSNILLGAVVASNIPFTGATVNIITTFKTIIYLSNRLHLLASIYGHPIICKEAMFVVATKIISSIIDYENNIEHKPLNPKVIEELYQHTMDSNLFELLKKSTIKDLYISVPLVGSLSLAKITLDEQSVTKLTLQLVCDYFDYQMLIQKYGQQALQKELKVWSEIYNTQKNCGWIEKLLKDLDTKKEKSSNFFKKIVQKIKDFEAREQLILQKIHSTAKQIYNTWKKDPSKNLEVLTQEFCQF